MTVTPVGLNQQVYMGQQNVAAQPVQQNAQVSQPVPVGQPYPTVQQVPQGQQFQYPQGNGAYPVVYPNNSVVNTIPQSTNTYENDILMQGIDFNKLAQEIINAQVAAETPTGNTAQNVPGNQTPPVNQQDPQTTQAQSPAFTGAVAQTQDSDNLTNCLVANEPAKKDDSKLKLGPTIGAVVGLATPFVCNKFKIGKFLSKDLMIKAPVMTAGGLCAGGIVEGLGASAKKLEANNAEEKAVAQMMDVKV